MPKKRYDPRDVQMRPHGRWSDETVRYRGIALPADFEVHLEHPGWHASAVMSIRVDPDTGPVVAGLRAGPEETATYQDVQALVSATRMDQLVTSATAYVAGVYAAMWAYQNLPSSLDASPERVGEVLGQHRDLVIAQAYPVVRKRQQRRLTPQFLREVAEVYRSAQDAGRPPTIAVADHFTVSHRTATRWAGEARKAGELTSPEGGADDGE